MKRGAKIFKGAAFLAIAGLIAKLIGALYRIPLTNVMGAEGIGLYQMVFPLYTLLLTISSGGLPTAISKVTAGYLAVNDEVGARKVLKVSLVSLSILGGVAALFIIFMRNQIAFVQGNSKASIAYLGIAPSLIFVSVIACFRGYFQGSQNMFPSAMSQVVEQVAKLFIGLFLAARLYPYGVEYAVLGALLGVSASELLAMIGLLIQFFFHNREYKKRNYIRFKNLSTNFESAADIALIPKEHKIGKIFLNLYKVAIPVTLGSLVLPLTQVIDSVLVINILTESGFSRLVATSMFGIINGPVSSLINMPIVITLSISVALLPKLSAKLIKKEDAARTVGENLKYAVMLGLPFAIILGFFSHEILTLLYRRGLTESQRMLGSHLLSLGSISIIYVCILQVATTVLQAYEKPSKPAINLLIGACFKVFLTLVLITYFNVSGAIIATVVCYAVTCFLDCIAMRKCVKVKVSLWETALSPLISGAGMAVVGRILFVLLKRLIPPVYAFITGVAIGAIVYIVLIFVTKGIKRSEVIELPVIGNVLKKLAIKKEMKKQKKEKLAAEKNGGKGL